MSCRVSCVLLALLLLPGCMVGPDYRTPVLKIPETYTAAPQQGATGDSATLREWWQSFSDPQLTSLVSRTITNNLDVRVAQARLQEARASLRYAQANKQLPTINVEGGYSREKSSADYGQAAEAGSGASYSLYQAAFDASFEIDLFGGVRRQIEASRAEAEASEDSLRDTLVSAVAEVAKDYILLRQYQEELALTRETERSRQETLRITRARRNAGLVGDLDVANAAASLASTQASVAVWESNVRQMIHAIALLLGQAPGELTEELTTVKPVPVAFSQIPPGLPSDLLRRRPDIRQAERSLAAATANIGVHVAELFPSISLTGQFGGQSGKVVGLVDAVARFYSVGPQIKWGILNYSAIKANIRAHEAKRDQQLLNYEKTVLTAFQEVENALVAFDRQQERQLALATEAEQYKLAANIAMAKYTHGLTNFLDVLDAQRSLYTAQTTLIQSRGGGAVQLIALYKALGGGWERNDPAMRAEEQPSDGL